MCLYPIILNHRQLILFYNHGRIDKCQYLHRQFQILQKRSCHCNLPAYRLQDLRLGFFPENINDQSNSSSFHGMRSNVLIFYCFHSIRSQDCNKKRLDILTQNNPPLSYFINPNFNQTSFLFAKKARGYRNRVGFASIIGFLVGYSQHFINIATLFQINLKALCNIGLYALKLRASTCLSVAVLLQMLKNRVTQGDQLVIFTNQHILNLIGVGRIYQFLKWRKHF